MNGMSLFSRVKTLRLLEVASLVLLIGAGLSCSPKDDSCAPSGATFRVTVQAAEGLLPSKLKITVKYGSGSESYEPPTKGSSSKVMYCDPHDGVDGGGFEKLVCTLWTDGAATVHVQAEGYAELVRTLVAQRDDCGLVLKDELLTLTAAN